MVARNCRRGRVFADVPISTSYLSLRSGVHSILLGTILAVLRPHIKDNPGATPQILTDIINEEANVQHIEMATTRVPEFGPHHQNPDNGYRYLGRLSSATVQLDIPPPYSPSSPLYPSHEILAVDGSHHLTQEFTEIMRLRTATHFIILFQRAGIGLKFLPSYTLVLQYG